MKTNDGSIQPVKQFDRKKHDETIVFVTVIIAATGVNFLVSGFNSIFSKRIAWIGIPIGIIIILISSFLYHLFSFKSYNKSAVVNGFVIIDQERHQILHVPNYNISLWMFCNSKIIMDEPEIYEKWIGSPIGQLKVDYEKKEIIHITNESERLLVELIEYCMLDLLSISLTDYFGNIDDIGLKTLNRDEMTDILNGNRILSVISDETGIIKDKKRAWNCLRKKTRISQI